MRIYSSDNSKLYQVVVSAVSDIVGGGLFLTEFASFTNNANLHLKPFDCRNWPKLGRQQRRWTLLVRLVVVSTVLWCSQSTHIPGLDHGLLQGVLYERCDYA